MGKKEKRQREEEGGVSAEEEKQQTTVIAEDDEEAEKKRRKAEKKEKRRAAAALEEAQEERSTTGGDEAEEEKAEPTTSKGKKKAKVDEDEAADDGDDAFDLSKLKKANKSASDSHSSSSPSDSSSGGSRVFLGNLPFKVTDELLVSHFESCGVIEGLHYVTDKTTGKFYGSAFLDFATPEAASAALALSGSSLLDRPIKVGMATGVHAQGPNRYNSKQKNGGHLAAAPVSAKPEGTKTVFLGNLAFDIDEDEVRRVFTPCGVIEQVRWVEKDGVFKGCGFIEFAETEATDAAVKLNGSTVSGRPIRVDYSGHASRA